MYSTMTLYDTLITASDAHDTVLYCTVYDILANVKRSESQTYQDFMTRLPLSCVSCYQCYVMFAPDDWVPEGLCRHHKVVTCSRSEMSPSTQALAFASPVGLSGLRRTSSVSAQSPHIRRAWGCTPVAQRVRAPACAGRSTVTATTEPVEVTADSFDAEVLQAVCVTAFFTTAIHSCIGRIDH